MTINPQYQLAGNELTLKVRKSPLFIRSVTFLFAFLFFISPIVAILGVEKLHIFYFIVTFLFALMGFYLLRIALWNTYGKEIITFNNDIIDYIADYGWFKDSKKQIAVKERLDYGIMPIGYEEDHEGTLIISLEELNIVCVTKMPISEIEKLIEKLHVMDEIPNIVNV